MNVMDVRKRVLDPATGRYVDEALPTDRNDTGTTVSATGGEDTALGITLPAGKTMLVTMLAVSGPDKATYKITDGSNTYLVVARTDDLMLGSIRSPITVIRNTSTSDMTINVTVTGTSGNSYSVSIGYHLI